MDNEFDWEFYTGEDTVVEDYLKDDTRDQLLELAEGHTDMIGASVAVERPAIRETPFIYEARIVVYMRPDNVVGHEKGANPEAALRGALRAVERQIRSRREKLAKPWERPRS
ncbi:MAG: 30S ribosomal protein S30 [Chloroflexi bacterium]|jgi:ribosome-associated translation inhibitor RaiA|nr:30S ribosomal protein S30 [Chloroflexota bacterium]